MQSIKSIVGLSTFARECLSLGALAAMALTAATLFVARAKRSRLTLLQSTLHDINLCFTRILWRTQIHGRFSFARGQGALIVCNHRSSIDPAFIQLAIGQRVVHWMVAREYCEQAAFAWFLRAAEVIPVGRAGIDTAATKMAIRLCQEGELVGLFPEGRINGGGDPLLPGRPGVALIALKARVPVVPCYIEGAPYQGTVLDPLITPAKVRLTIGAPIDLSAYYGREGEREVLEEATLQLLRAMASLAGHPDFQPRLAGRFYATDGKAEG